MDATRITLNESPDVMFGCMGGGSNFAGAVFPYIGDTLQGHGDFDLAAYDDYLNGRIVDPEEPADAIRRSISKLMEV